MPQQLKKVPVMSSPRGLSCSEHNLSLLTQALYPVDATAENMKVLAGNCTELAAMKVPGTDDIYRGSEL
ncbi:Uncharacterised protein [Klebsiella pneumoniae]|nr:Uncharacterised protein [Klebsiella pneumoniae]